MWEFQRMIYSSVTSYTVTKSTWARGFSRLVGSWGWDVPSYYPNLCVCKCVCLFLCLCVCQIVCLLCFYVVILNVFVFQIYSMLKWQNEIVIHFVEGHPSSLNLMTFCQLFHGDYWPPCSFFHKIAVCRMVDLSPLPWLWFIVLLLVSKCSVWMVFVVVLLLLY